MTPHRQTTAAPAPRGRVTADVIRAVAGRPTLAFGDSDASSEVRP